MKVRLYSGAGEVVEEWDLSENFIKRWWSAEKK